MTAGRSPQSSATLFHKGSRGSDLKNGRRASTTIDNVLAAVDDFHTRIALAVTPARRERAVRRTAPKALDERRVRRYLREVENGVRTARPVGRRARAGVAATNGPLNTFQFEPTLPVWSNLSCEFRQVLGILGILASPRAPPLVARARSNRSWPADRDADAGRITVSPRRERRRC
ncbi:hypothetical protein GCM10022252_79140 [Streptosporangium oxazolinicum]|uniref:Uncharacterized protein n=1 Tax=Streptosporangium oxazolinicum TaxID=909287 RepID=A0ABP8BN24_9ACTN